jgi:phi13 family phage major tail protein
MASTTNKVRFGASHVVYAIETDGVISSTWTDLAGAVQISFSPQNSSNTFYADNMGYYMTTGAASDEFSIELADMTDAAKQDILGYIVDDVSGLFIEPVNADHKTFAMGYQVEGDGNVLRGIKYGCTLNRPSEEHNTTTDSTDPDTLTLEGTAIGKKFTVDGELLPVLGGYCTNAGDTPAAFDKFYVKPPQPGVAAPSGN